MLDLNVSSSFTKQERCSPGRMDTGFITTPRMVGGAKQNRRRVNLNGREKKKLLAIGQKRIYIAPVSFDPAHFHCDHTQFWMVTPSSNLGPTLFYSTK